MNETAGTWRVWVTEDDLRAAHRAWARARTAGAPPDRVHDLAEELERMVRTAAFQVEGDPWRTAREPADLRCVASLTAHRFARRPARLSAAG